MIARLAVAVVMFASIAGSALPVQAQVGLDGSAAPKQLHVGVPAGWSSRTDPKTGAVAMTPPDARSGADAGLIVFPAVDFAGAAEQYHSDTLATLVGASRQLEPVAHGPAGGFLVSVAHFQTPQNVEMRIILYTARWGSRAQAIVFAAARGDLFTHDSPAAAAVVKDVSVPSADAVGIAPAATPAPNGTGDSMPVLEYSDPPNFFRAGGKQYAEYQGSDVNFTLCVYPFREFQGDARAAFQETLLRDSIDVLYREEGLAGRPQFTANTMPGADAVLDAHFVDSRQQQHHRVLIVAGHWAALIDMIAPTAFAWQKGYASAAGMLRSVHVGTKPAPPSLAQGPGPEGAALAGLFQGMKQKYVVNLQLGSAFGGSKTALHYVLLSATGRVYRCYDFPPGGNAGAARQFDFDAAERQDPGNSGRFTVRGNQLYMKFGGPNPDEITATVTDPNVLQLDGVSYERQR